jgi:hypothetical protein
MSAMTSALKSRESAIQYTRVNARLKKAHQNENHNIARSLLGFVIDHPQRPAEGMLHHSALSGLRLAGGEHCGLLRTSLGHARKMSRMKFTIRPKVQKDKIIKAIPRPLVDRLPSAVLTDNEYALILFGLDQDCITSATVRKALERVRDLARPIIVTGSLFTIDALRLLERNNAIVACERESFGTDASNEWAKTLIRSKVKTPAHR